MSIQLINKCLTEQWSSHLSRSCRCHDIASSAAYPAAYRNQNGFRKLSVALKAKQGLSDFSNLRRWFGGHYCGRTDCRNPASFAMALYCGIGSSSLNALVNAFERLHKVRAWNASCTG